MAEEVKPDGLVTRAARTFKNSKTLQHATLAVGFAAGAIGLGHVAAKPKDDLEHVKSVGAAAIKPAVDPYGAGADIIKMTGDAMLPHLQQVQNPSNGVKIETVEAKEDSVDGVIDIFYPEISREDRGTLRDQINITKEYMKSILPTDAYQNIANHQQLFSDIEKYSGVPEELMGGLACAESRGGVDALSSAGAVGHFQISDAMWEEAGNTVTGDEFDGRLDWKKSAEFTAEELAATNLYFATKENPNWGLAAWRWHMGRRGVREQIENYSASHGQSFTDLREYIKENKITVFSILQIKNIREALEEPGYDQTPIYVLRIAACASILEDMKNYEIKNAPNQD